VHLVTTAEEMPVTETIETYETLRDELQLPVGMLVVNRVHRGVEAGDVLARVEAGAEQLGAVDRSVVSEIAARAHEENAWAGIHRVEMERLRVAVPVPTCVIPELYVEEFGAADVRRVAELLEAAWQARAPLGDRAQRGQAS